MPDSPAEPAPSHRNQRSMEAFWRLYGQAPGGVLRQTQDVCLTLSGIPHPLFNGMHRARPADAGQARAMVAEVKTLLNEVGVPALWWTLPETTTPPLAEALLAGGATCLGPAPAMELALEQLPPLTLPGVEVREVTSDELALWAEIAARGTDLPPEVVSALSALEPQLPVEPHRRRFLAWRGGEAVGSACTIEAGPDVGIFAIAVLPAHRRGGLGALLTVEPLRAAAARGCRTALLQASEMGYPVYRRLGFAHQGDYTLYLQTPGA
ncbi:MAG: GNAT family N-acetyltransferase [Verrucomicrobia bacterium]|nr:GNAT family N-acetyltransferase [Verrucomicrobiota bacterium]